MLKRLSESSGWCGVVNVEEQEPNHLNQLKRARSVMGQVRSGRQPSRCSASLSISRLASGDVFVFIEEVKNRLFERHGDDVLYSLRISMPQAVIGDDVEIPTLNGKARLKIDAGVQCGKILRMRGKGIPHLHGSGHGDQLVKVIVWTPIKPSHEVKTLFKKLAEFQDVVPEQAS